MPSSAFFTLHRDLPREGPGLPEDVHWALKTAGTPEEARILDAASGPGADTVTLAQARPAARIDAVDLTPHFVAETARRTAPFGTRVTAREGDYTTLFDSYDLIWCAGAMYFKGFLTVLDAWRDHLKPGGAIAFSEPALVKAPPPEPVKQFWEGEGTIRPLSELEDLLVANGWQIVGQRWIIGAGWEAYYGPQEARCEKLKADGAEADVQEVIREAEREIALWKSLPDQIAYSLFVVRPA